MKAIVKATPNTPREVQEAKEFIAMPPRAEIKQLLGQIRRQSHPA